MTPRIITLKTSAGPCAVRFAGRGPKILVVHGGPGFSHDYMTGPLTPLCGRRTLVFFDQLGSHGSRAPSTRLTANALFGHLREVAAQIAENEPVGVIAHSWGVLATLASGLEFNEALFVAPMALTAQTLAASQRNLFARVPPDIMSEFERLTVAGAAGDDLIDLMLPYYLADNSSAPVENLHFDQLSFNAVIGSLGDFDFRDAVTVDCQFHLLLGLSDFTTEDLLPEMTAGASTVHRLQGVGHFPLHESVKASLKIAHDVFAH